MLYALRNSEGRITGLSETYQDGAEKVDMSNPDVRDFLSVNDENFSPDAYLDQSDKAISRIIEDLIALLIDKNVIIFTDLPDGAQGKLLTRKLARGLIRGDVPEEAFDDISETSILSDEDELL